jgi:hypothetical protein
MTFEARHPTRLSIVLAVACGLLALMGVWIALVGSAGEAWPLTGAVITIACLGASAIFVRRAMTKEVQMRIDATGVDWTKLKRPIPWDQIVDAKIVWMRRRPLLCVALRNPEAYPLKSAIGRTLAVADGALGFGHMGLNVLNLDRSFDDMVAAVRHYRPDLF